MVNTAIFDKIMFRSTDILFAWLHVCDYLGGAAVITLIIKSSKIKLLKNLSQKIFNRDLVHIYPCQKSIL